MVQRQPAGVQAPVPGWGPILGRETLRTRVQEFEAAKRHLAKIGQFIERRATELEMTEELGSGWGEGAWWR